MRYFAQYDETGRLVAIGTGSVGHEITEEEYNHLMEEIHAKAELVDQLYAQEISIDEVPEVWREEVQRRVDERIENDKPENREISAEEALAIIVQGG